MSSANAPKTLQPDQSLEGLWKEQVFTVARLECDPLTEKQRKDASALLDQIDRMTLEQRAHWKAEIVAEAQVHYRNQQLDLTTERLVKRLRFVHGGPGNTEFDFFFPTEAPSRVIRKRLEAQLDDSKLWPERLAKSSDAELQAFAPQIAQCLADGQVALDARTVAESNTKQHRIDRIEPLIDNLNKQRDTLFAKLIEIATAQGLDRAWARTFFK